MQARERTIVFVAAGALLAAALLANVPVAPEEAGLAATSYAPLPIAYDGSATSPDAVRISLPGAEGARLFDATVVRNGLDPRVFLTVAGPDDEVYEVRGSILVVGSLGSPSFKIHALDGATETFAARIQNSGVSPSVDVWVNGTPDKPAYYHLESPLRYRLEEGQMHSLAVLDPSKSDGRATLRLDRSATGYRLMALDYQATIPSNLVEVQQPGEGRTTLVFRDETGAERQRVYIDRTSDPARVTMAGEIDQVLSGPLAVEGDPANPKRIVAYDAEGATVLAYAASDGKSTLDVAGTRVLENATFVRIEGDPFTESFTLVLRDATGKQHRAFVDRAPLFGLGAQTGAPIVEVLAPLSALSGMPEGMLDLVRTERGGALKSSQLDGTHSLAAQGLHAAYLHTAEGAPAFERILLDVRTGGQNAQAAFAHAGYVQGGAVWTATYVPGALGAVEEGQPVELDVLYEKRLSPFAVQSYHDARTYRYKLDGTPPTISLSAPATSSKYTFDVAWNGTDGSGIRGYEAQYREAGSATWQRWVEETAEPSQSFSGDWGASYQFRARSFDLVGNPSDWAEATTTVAPQPADEDEVNDAPTVRILAPRAGDSLTGIVEASWSASDPDGTPVTVNVQVSSDDGHTWRTLHSGTGSSYSWDTTFEADGSAYRLRATATDGTLSSADATGAFSVLNHAIARQALPADRGAQSGNGGGGGASGESSTGDGDGAAGGGDGDGDTAPGSDLGTDGAVDAGAQGEPEKKGFLGIPGPGAFSLVAALGVAAYAAGGGRGARRSR